MKKQQFFNCKSTLTARYTIEGHERQIFNVRIKGCVKFQKMTPIYINVSWWDVSNGILHSNQINFLPINFLSVKVGQSTIVLVKLLVEWGTRLWTAILPYNCGRERLLLCLVILRLWFLWHMWFTYPPTITHTQENSFFRQVSSSVFRLVLCFLHLLCFWATNTKIYRFHLPLDMW